MADWRAGEDTPDEGLGAEGVVTQDKTLATGTVDLEAEVAIPFFNLVGRSVRIVSQMLKK